MLADEVRLELVARTRMNGRNEVRKYFHNYALVDGWHFVRALVDRRPALLYESRRPIGDDGSIVLLQWAGHRLTNIPDFRYARVM